MFTSGPTNEGKKPGGGPELIERHPFPTSESRQFLFKEQNASDLVARIGEMWRTQRMAL